ncbi:MAG TPA: hypothetical protein ENJ90_05860 [Devosia sp.]|nr:hypothetical protein [Devosia sp.]
MPTFPGPSSNQHNRTIRTLGVLGLLMPFMATPGNADPQTIPGLATPPGVIVTPARLLPETIPLPDAHSVSPPPMEPYQPFFEIDWSVALIASRTGGSRGSRYATTLAPQFSATRAGLRSGFVFEAQARLGVNSDQLTRVEEVLLSANGNYALDSVTRLNGAAGITLSQDDPNAPGSSDQIIQTPLEGNAQVQLGIARQFGRFALAFDADLSRRQQTDTILVGNIAEQNPDRNVTGLGGTLRGEFELTPVLTGFVEGSVARDWYDAPPAGTNIKQDGWDLTMTTGLAANWRDVFQLEASVGQGERRFENASIGNFSSLLYGLDFAYTPNNALAFDAQLSTALNPADPSSGSQASTDYTITAAAGYQLAPWVGLRGSLGQAWSVPGTDPVQSWSFYAGTGLDFALNKNADLSLDYLYTRTRALPRNPQDSHLLSLGLTWSK